MKCGLKLFKIFLTVLNSLIFIASLSIIIYCSWIKIGKDSLSKVLNIVNLPLIELPDLVGSILNLIITIASFFLVISFCGSFGAIFQKKMLLKSYGAVVILNLIIQLIALGMFMFAKEKIMELFDNAIFHFVATVYELDVTKSLGLSKLWDSIQIGFQCCGFHGSSDFSTLPLSCCKPDSVSAADILTLDFGAVVDLTSTLTDCVGASTSSNSNIDIPCKSIIDGLLSKISNIIISIVMSFAVFEILIFIGTVKLIKEID